jgi:hypothetical protein
MNEVDVIKLLPPVLLGFGAVLPILITKIPFPILDGTRTLLATIMVLLVWAGYWISLLTSNRFFYSNLLTFFLLVAAIIALIVVFLQLQKRTASSLSSSLIMYVYLVALLLVSVAAANYVAAKNRVVVNFIAPEHISQVRSIGGGVNAHRLDLGSTGHGARALMESKDFDQTEQFELTYGANTIRNVPKEAAIHQTDPGLGTEYTIDSKDSPK